MAAGDLARSVCIVEGGRNFPGATVPPLSIGALLPIQGRAEAFFSAIIPVTAYLGQDPPRPLLAMPLFTPFVSRLEPRGESGPVLCQGCAGVRPGGRERESGPVLCPGCAGGRPGGREVTASLPRARCNLTFSNRDAFNSWRN